MMTDTEIYRDILRSFNFLGYKIKTKVLKHQGFRYLEHYIFLDYRTLIIVLNLDEGWFRYGSLESSTLKLTKLRKEDIDEYSDYLFYVAHVFYKMEESKKND